MRLTSVGSGSVMAVILLLLYPLTSAVVVITDIAYATVLSLVTGFARMLNGNVDLRLAGTLLLGSIPDVLFAALAGSRLLANQEMHRGRLGILGWPNATDYSSVG